MYDVIRFFVTSFPLGSDIIIVRTPFVKLPLTMTSLVKGGFNSILNGSGKKRTNTSESEIPRNSKIPRAADITIEQGPRPTQTQKRLPANAPVDVCIYRFTQQASDLWDLLQDHNVSLYQIQIRHEAQKAITFSMRDSFNDFLRASHKQENRIPSTLAELETTCGVRLVVNDRADPDDVGYVQWRVAFYCIDLSNFMLLLDGWFRHKERQTLQPFEINIHPHVGIDLQQMWTDLEYAHYSLRDQQKVLPLHIFQAQPVIGKRITSMNIQIESDTTINVVFTGHTWPYRKRLDDFGISGGYYNEDANIKETRSYFRVWKEIDISDEDVVQRFMNMLGDEVFKHVAMRVTLDKEPEPDSEVQKFIVDKLQSRPSLFFNNIPKMQMTQESSRDDGNE